ncbi:MAG: hypothetical protein HXS52_04075 [Theionarchaea archaeon]|nr:hypothetical protein [Theionarchaea archaeon]
MSSTRRVDFSQISPTKRMVATAEDLVPHSILSYLKYVFIILIPRTGPGGFNY